MRWSFIVQDVLTLACCALCLLLASGCDAEHALPPILDLELTDPAEPADTGSLDDPIDDPTDDTGGDADPGDANADTADDLAESDDDLADTADDLAADDIDASDVPDADPVGPDNAYCAAVEAWDKNSALLEEQVLELVNLRRGEGAVCGDTAFGPANPLAEENALRCAARAHAEDMAVRDFFAHTNPDGEGPGERIDRAEYQSRTWGENIAYGYPSPESVVEGWMNSPGHCANIMNPSFTEVGIGYHEGNQWVQVFGTPR